MAVSETRADAWKARRGAVPARQSGMREHNLALALREVARADEPVSRADIASATGVTRATASSLVDALVGAGLVTEAGTTSRTRGGRPATGLVLAAAGAAGLGLEVNVDYVAACVVDLTGAVRHRQVEVDDWRGMAPATVLERAAQLAET